MAKSNYQGERVCFVFLAPFRNPRKRMRVLQFFGEGHMCIDGYVAPACSEQSLERTFSDVPIHRFSTEDFETPVFARYGERCHT